LPATPGALCYIELGTGVSEAGCDFAYVVHVGWHALAFAFMWVSVLLTYPASGAVQALTFGQYAMQGLAPIATLNPPYHAIAERGLGLLLLGMENLHLRASNLCFAFRLMDFSSAHVDQLLFAR
jgi:hypothetical protein